MPKERIFRREITIDNFKLVSKKEFATAGISNKGKSLTKEAELIAQVYYTPRGYSCEIEQFNPLDTWSIDHFCRIEGISDEAPEGDLVDKYFDTKLAAMHFITRRLKRLNWEPLDGWHDA